MVSAQYSQAMIIYCYLCRPFAVGDSQPPAIGNHVTTTGAAATNGNTTGLDYE